MCPGGSWGVCVLGEGERKLLKKYVLGTGGVYWMSWGGGGGGEGEGMKVEKHVLGGV